MITGLPKNIPYDEINLKFKEAFDKMFAPAGTTVVNAKVIGKFDTVYKLCQKLKNQKESYSYYKRFNKSNSKRATVIKVQGWCRADMKYDAEDYFREKILKTTQTINELKVEKLKVNSGIGFVTFLSNSDLKSCLEETH
jgi:Cytosolic domain of 10TM putative phosphate transporter